MGKSSGNEIVEELSKDILNKIPDEFNIKQVQVGFFIIKSSRQIVNVILIN
jgi:hypothetical protein